MKDFEIYYVKSNKYLRTYFIDTDELICID